jgi:hypothetical protein
MVEKSTKMSQTPFLETSMFNISQYALSDEIAEQLADEVRDLIESQSRAWDEAKKLRDQLAEETAKRMAYQFALQIYGWTGE